MNNQNRLEKYRTAHRHYIDQTDFGCGSCWNVFQLLPELTGTKVSIGTIALVQAFGADSVRITTGEITCDACSGRATIYVDTDDIIRKIEMEIYVECPNEWGSMCGADFVHKLKG